MDWTKGWECGQGQNMKETDEAMIKSKSARLNHRGTWKMSRADPSDFPSFPVTHCTPPNTVLPKRPRSIYLAHITRHQGG